MWRCVVVAGILLTGCGSSEPPENLALRGLDGEVLEADEMVDGPAGSGSTTSVAAVGGPNVDATIPQDGWISPEFAQKLSVPGTNMTQYVYFSPYTEGPEFGDANCAAYSEFRNAEGNATVEAGVSRATNEAIRSGGLEGTVLHAHAISFATPAIAESVGEIYLDTYRTCRDDRAVESVVRPVEAYGDINEIVIQEDDGRPLRIAYMQRSNVVLVTLSVVAPEDAAIYQSFLDLAGERLMGQVFQDEVLPEDMDPALLALEEEIRNSR